MPFNNNTLDDLFREKDKELPAGTHRMDAHWEQMQQLLANPAPAKRTGRYLVPGVIGLAVLLTGGILFFALRNNNKTAAGNEANNVAIAAKTEAVHTVPVIANNESSNKNQPAAKATVAPVPASSAQKITESNISPAPVAATTPAKHKQEYIVLPQEPQVFHIMADKDTAVLCKHGTTIKIPANSLADANGNTVEGEVTMIVQEYYRYEDIIAAGLDRNAEMKKKSITAGMVKFDAYRDEQKLDLRPGRSIEIRMRKDLINVKPGQVQQADANTETANQMPGLNIHNLGWISYERFYNDARPVTDIRIQVPRNVDANRLISQLAFVSVEGVMPGYIENNQVVFYNIPVGEKAWFISLGKTGKKFLSCVEQLEIKGNDVVTPTFRETSPEQFKRQLEMLTALPVKEH